MSLTAWLKELSLSHVAGALEEVGITTTNDLAIQREDDLKEIIKELDLKPRQKIKFKVSVRKLEVADQPRFVLTSAEESAIKSLLALNKSAKSSLASIEKTMEAVRKNGEQTRAKISSEFRGYQKELKQREKNLLDDATAKEQEKISQLEEQCHILTDAIAQFTQAKIDSDKMLNVASSEGIENRTKSVAAKVADIAKLQFPKKAATAPHIRYESDQRALNQNISGHGNVVLYADIKPPKITNLKEGTDTIQVSWEVPIQPGAPQEALPCGFGIRVSELPSTLVDADAGNEGKVGLETEYQCDGKDDSYHIKELKMDTEYRIWVKVKSKCGWSSYGTPSTAKTLSRPTSRPTTFQDSSLLDQKSDAKLLEFIGGECQSSLLYKASRDGFASTDFHKHCDQKGPTVTVIKRNGSEAVFGGYTPLNWNSTVSWQRDDELRTFLFTMSDENGHQNKYALKQSGVTYAIYCGLGYGPLFGAGHDLMICNNSNTSKGSSTNPTSYEVPSQTTLCGQYNGYTIAEIEVFSISN